MMVYTSVWRRLNDAANLNVDHNISLFFFVDCDFACYWDC
jgi:hypothetical protein